MKYMLSCLARSRNFATFPAVVSVLSEKLLMTVSPKNAHEA